MATADDRRAGRVPRGHSALAAGPTGTPRDVVDAVLDEASALLGSRVRVERHRPLRRPPLEIPILSGTRTWGYLVSSRPPRTLATVDVRRLHQLARLAGLAVTVASSSAQTSAARLGAEAAADQARHRLQRDVHDGAQGRVTQTIIALTRARDRARRGEPVTDLIDEALAQAERASADLRDLVHGLAPRTLAERGLAAALQELVTHTASDVLLHVESPRLPPRLEEVAYFIVAEGVTNALKHARAQTVSVTVRLVDAVLRVDVEDDGLGGADPTLGTGLVGLVDRAAAAGGTLVLQSPSAGGTRLRAELPVPRGSLRRAPVHVRSG